MRKIHIAGLVALAGLALACGSASDGDKDVAAPAEAPKAGDSPQPKAKAAGIGDKVRDGKFEFTVTKMNCDLTKVGNEYVGTKAQGKFCLVNITVKNIGKEAQMFDSSSQKAFDAEGTQYDADGGAAIYVNEDAETFLNNINPGNQVKGVVPFDVPKDVKIVKLELHDSPFSGGVSVAVK